MLKSFIFISLVLGDTESFGAHLVSNDIDFEHVLAGCSSSSSSPSSSSPSSKTGGGTFVIDSFAPTIDTLREAGDAPSKEYLYTFNTS